MQLKFITRRKAVTHAYPRQNCPNGTLTDDAHELHGGTFHYVNDESGHAYGKHGRNYCLVYEIVYALSRLHLLSYFLIWLTYAIMRAPAYNGYF